MLRRLITRHSSLISSYHFRIHSSPRHSTSVRRAILYRCHASFLPNCGTETDSWSL